MSFPNRTFRAVGVVSATVLFFSSFRLFAAQMASQNWVEMRLEQMRTNIVTQIEKAKVRQEPTINAKDKTISFVDAYGKTLTIPYELTAEAYDREALMVYSSEKSKVPAGTIFAYDKENEVFRNSSIAIPGELRVSDGGDGRDRLTWTNEIGTIYAYSQSHAKGEHYLLFIYLKSGDSEVKYDTLALGRVLVQKSMELAVGVTNEVKTARSLASSPSPRRLSPRDGSVYPTKGYVTLTLDVSSRDSSATNQYVNVELEYRGPYNYILQNTDDIIWSRNDWIYEEDWADQSNWLNDSYDFDVTVPTEVYDGNGDLVKDEYGNQVYEDMTFHFTFTKKNIVRNFILVLPNYSLPPYRSRDKSDCLKTGNHNWKKCKCTICGTVRSHWVVADKENPEKCWKCQNKDGWADDANEKSTICGMMTEGGGPDATTKTAISKHWGWHPVGNSYPTSCSCQCGAYTISHEFDENEEDAAWTQGAISENGQVVSDIMTYHHRLIECIRYKSFLETGDQCGGEQWQNEKHVWDEDVDGMCSPWTGDLDEQGEPVKCDKNDEKANVGTHVNFNKACEKCKYLGWTYESHDFDDRCTCTKCELEYHPSAKKCGEVVFCGRCNYVFTSDSEGHLLMSGTKVKDTDFELHDKTYISQYGIGHDDGYHWCTCRNKREAHKFGMADASGVKTCSVCGYRTPPEEDDSGDDDEDDAPGGGGDGTLECDKENGVHYRREYVCGCKCGYFPNEAVGAEGLHMWKSNTCFCVCGKRHRFIEGNPCEKICNGCKTMVVEGNVAESSYKQLHVDVLGSEIAEYHTPCTADDKHCGCKCGEFDVRTASVSEAKFHVQMPGTCKCYGSGDGGDWHFPKGGNACSKICILCREENGGLGYLYKKGSPTEGKTAAKESDHVAAQAGCGCKCYQASKGKCGIGKDKYLSYDANFHKFGGGSISVEGQTISTPSCFCECGTFHKSDASAPQCETICGNCLEPLFKGTKSFGLKFTASPKLLTKDLLANEEDHVPVDAGSESCGCKCGFLNKEDKNIPEVLKYHVPVDAGSDGVLVDDSRTTCTNACVCGRMNDKSFEIHYRSSKSCTCYCGKSGIHCPIPTAGCPDVCAGGCEGLCADTTPGASKGKVNGYNHTPKENGCGCACGAYGADKYEMKSLAELGTLYHNGENATLSCRCECGRYHPMMEISKGLCDGVCAVCGYNKDCSSDAASLHTPSSEACACKCGKIKPVGSLVPMLIVFHCQNPSGCGCICGGLPKDDSSHRRSNDSCVCYCGEKHYGSEFRRADCRNICNRCGYLADRPPQTAATLFDHTPKSGGCGCACGAYGADRYDATSHIEFHGGTNDTLSCRCVCGAAHSGYKSSACPRICATCGRSRDFKEGDEYHDFANETCTCKCGKLTSHRYADDKCQCYCGEMYREHSYETSETDTGSYVCSVCSRTIKKVSVRGICSRCGAEYESSYDTGHSSTCSNYEEEDDNVPFYCAVCCCYDGCEVCRKDQKGAGDVCLGCGRSCYKESDSDKEEGSSSDAGTETGGGGSGDKTELEGI